MTASLVGKEVLIRHPYIGSEWMTVVEETKSPDGRPWLILQAWDASEAGSSMMPDDYLGQPCIVNFPRSCVAKVLP